MSIRAHSWLSIGLRCLPLCVVLAYWGLLIHQLGAQWSVYAQYSYGWAVPVLCLYLLWQSAKRDHKTADHETSVRSPAVSGPVVLLSCLLLALLYAPTRLLHEANPIWRLTSWLWALEVIAITWLLLSTLNPQRSTRFAFPLCFFLVAVPWPSGVEHFLVQTLTGLNVTTTIELLNAFGIPALQHGNIIEISTGVVGVDEACSGIRSFQATLMLSLFFGELYSLTVKRRIVLCLLGFAASLVFNVARTFILTYLASKQGVPEIEKWHDPAGITVLVWCFVAIWFASLVMKPPDKREPQSRKGKSGSAAVSAAGSSGVSPPGSALERGASPSISHPQPSTLTPQPSAASATPPSALRLPPSVSRPRPSTLNSQPSTVLACSFSLLAWLVLVEVGVEWWYRSNEQSGSRTANWSLRTGDLESSFTRIETPEAVLRQFNADVNTELRWQDDQGANWQLYYFRWRPAASLQRRVTVQLAKSHGPEICLAATGMKLESDFGIKKVQVAGLTLALQHYVFGAQGRPVHVFYAIYEDPTGTEVLANRRRDASSRVAAALAGSRNYGQRFLEVAVWGIANERQAEAALQRQLEKLIRVGP